MKIFKDQMIDERQELQSLKNMAKITKVTLFVLLGVAIVQMLVLQLPSGYYLPELIIVLLASVATLIMEWRSGNLYTKEYSSGKYIKKLYIGAPAVLGVVVAVTNYIRYDFAPWMMIIIFLIEFTITFLLIIGLDALWRRATRKRMEKLASEVCEDAADDNSIDGTN